MEVLAVIPARYRSTRLPGKPLANLGGHPMVEWVYRAARAAHRVHRVVVATDDERILQTVRDFGGEAVMTRPDHPTGTDRMAEVAGLFPDCRVFLNVQGDEPLLRPEPLNALVDGFLGCPGTETATLVRPAHTLDEVLSPHTAKVVRTWDGHALYFSRAPIPFEREPSGQLQAWLHIGVYIYEREFLEVYSGLPQRPLELAEKLEQLRVLESGYRMLTVETQEKFHGVDTPEDLERVRALVASRRLNPL
ncbi:MAG: 3-deoxy-manno-octulosonate cytidylyltransferase [Candidatus Riflebacteria bacterium]|nr:3-deoxy-manno-octulosonate cytidylyltransferase [Candidatus Riflebacteria bacterium]